MDADAWKRLLCSKQFGKKCEDLCNAIAGIARKLCVRNLDPTLLTSLTACRLVPLDKKPGVRPVGIGEVLRRIIGKTVMTLLQKDLVGATAPIQVCAGLQGGVEAAVHAARDCFEDPETEAIILVDAENAFNLLNREAALNNMYIVCPEVATYIMNTYRMPARLFIAGGDEHLFSEEGTTQGDPPAMGFYACGTIPLIDSGNIERKVTQIWYADDSAAGGKLEEMRKWWDNLCIKGPLFGYVSSHHLLQIRRLFV